MKSNIFLYFLFFSFILGQIPRLRIGEVSLLLNDFVVGFFVFFYFLVSFFKKEKLKIPKIFKYVLMFFLIATFSLFINFPNFPSSEILISSLYLLRWIIYALLLLVFFNTKFDKEKIIFGLIFTMITISIIGILQYFFYPDLRNLEYLGWDPHYYRVFVPFFDPTFTGAILTLGFILLISKSFSQKPSLLLVLGGLLMYIALALTYSRASYLMYLIAMSLISIVKKSPKFFATVIVIGAITLILLPKEKSYGTNLKREETLKARIENWKNSFQIWKDHPIFGVGFDTYRYTQRKYGFINEKDWQISHSGGGADSSLLFVAATTGTLGLIGYLFLIFTIIKISLRNLKDTISLTLFASTISLLFHSLFANSLFYPFIMEWIWILAGIQNGVSKENK